MFALETSLVANRIGHTAHGALPAPVPLDVDNPLDTLAHEHIRQKWLCDVLETIADGLPGNLEVALARAAADILKTDAPRHHEKEETCLFPLLTQRAQPDDNIEALIRQLTREHLADDTYSSDLIHLLEEMAEGERPANPEMAGYMIRGFLESYRRHIAFEDLVIMPLARLRLTSWDLTKLHSCMRQYQGRIGNPRH